MLFKAAGTALSGLEDLQDLLSLVVDDVGHVRTRIGILRASHELFRRAARLHEKLLWAPETKQPIIVRPPPRPL
jgi:hypothetical protein